MQTPPIGGQSDNNTPAPANAPQKPDGLPKGYDQIVDFYHLQGATPQQKIQFVNAWIQQNVTEPMNKTLQYEHARAKALAPFYSGDDDFPELPPR